AARSVFARRALGPFFPQPVSVAAKQPVWQPGQQPESGRSTVRIEAVACLQLAAASSPESLCEWTAIPCSWPPSVSDWTCRPGEATEYQPLQQGEPVGALAFPGLLRQRHLCSELLEQAVRRPLLLALWMPRGPHSTSQFPYLALPPAELAPESLL